MSRQIVAISCIGRHRLFSRFQRRTCLRWTLVALAVLNLSQGLFNAFLWPASLRESADPGGTSSASWHGSSGGSSLTQGAQLVGGKAHAFRDGGAESVGMKGLAVNVGAGVAAVGFLKVLMSKIHNWFKTPKRPYGSGSVGDAYDEWTREGVLEHYWGEHIHMGSYHPMEKQSGYRKKDGFVLALLRATFGHLKNFKESKIDFVYEMIEWSGAKTPKKILDVGCGIGGTSRILAKKFPDAEVLGITLSPQQVERATGLAKEQGLSNVRFEVMNALEMQYEDNTYDLVYGCESGEHMPDKKRYIEEMTRVLKPGGNLVAATWCERDPVPMFTQEERDTLDFLYAEWSHPYFISLSKYKDFMTGTGALTKVETADWSEQTLPAWRHSIWVGAWSPWYWLKISLRRPASFLGFLREVYTLEQYHKSMVSGLMVYGMMRAV
eukprot:CAMPEP_0197660546 /NCGR_PEP_ID=MMETSP1338-20131121/50911_1 /TAXON_ID=43686 ORGANISM="Pelagodinium beii, Strain RCC1491" /NCGR_SAMPLE_ID=MMETSP1338 /ASSEMBLY_ACC=CAM_ASM_000754 /LENGTH=436 /DNA_ID=CAMNT_0043237915 /DNA_START=43 /DNA_END=1349 /DNA_ORIENTATION=+